MALAMNTAPIRSDWVGRVVDGRFTLLQWLGGSDGSGVFLTELGGDRPQKAAIKLIPADTGNAEARIAEWAATANISHPHLMRLFHTGRCQIDGAELLYSVTEYAEEVLAEILPERPLTAGEAREMLDPILDALFYLHGIGLVHGRLKPSNIMVVDNQLKLSSDSLHVAGERGKQDYAPGVYDAPEYAAGTISPAADVWSFGVTLVAALTQNPPDWDRSTGSEPVVPRSVPQPFGGIVEECLRLDPVQRCTLSYVKLRLDPARFLPGPAGNTGKAAPGRTRATILVVAALVLIAGIAAMLVRSHRVEPSFQSDKKLVMAIPAPAPQSPASAPAQAPTPTSAPAPDLAPVPTPAPRIQTSKAAMVKGEVADRVLPDVLPSASESIEGQVNVRVRVTVDPSGNVSNAEFDSQGPSRYFSKVALQAAQHWRFKPAEVDGQPVSSVWILHFHFTRSAAEVTPVEATP